MLSHCRLRSRRLSSVSSSIAKASNRKFSAATTTSPPRGIRSIALNNPQRRNALSTPVLESLLSQLHMAKADPSTRVVVIKGLDDETLPNGVFCSGHDLKELSQRPHESLEAYQRRMENLFSLCSQVMTEIATFPVPTIAQVDGIATAAGCQLVASCDLALATATSRFATPGVHLGLFCSTPAVPVVRTVARKHAMELLLTGDMISAQRAYEMALINRVVGDLHEDPQQVQNLAASMASKSTVCIQSGLRTLRAQQHLPLHEAYQLAEKAMAENLVSGDAAEGIDAFWKKRKPSW
jgi:enoyl-CoA hydratase/carnithine racemase